MAHINWFPGHMNKARREIGELMPQVDFVLEILDARIPSSSENPLLEELREGKPCVKLLNKSDLADPAATQRWIEHFESQPGVRAVSVQRGDAHRVRGVMELGRSLLPPERNAERRVLALIAGIPNVGKSTLINVLIGRSLAKTGNIPAVTRKQQRIPLGREFVLMDSPGFLWPRLSPPEAASRLAVTGAIKDALLDHETLAFFILPYLRQHYPQRLMDRYELATLPEDPMEILEAMGARRGCIGRGGFLQLDKISELLIRELRRGALGPLTLESPEGVMEEQQRAAEADALREEKRAARKRRRRRR